MSHPQEPSLEGSIFFYPPEYYVFDNFSSFQVEYKGKVYPTSEHAYQSSQFVNTDKELAERIRNAKSAHEAFKLAEANKDKREKNWDDIKQKIFKIGEKVVQYGTNQEKGSGLGLLLVKEFVTLLNGTIDFESEKGKGTTFTVTLPLNL